MCWRKSRKGLLIFSEHSLTFSYLLCLSITLASASYETTVYGRSENPVTINILGLFELSNCELAQNGLLELQSAKLAVDLANKRNLIPGYRLQLLFNDTMCDAGRAIYAYLQAIAKGPTVQFLLGPDHDEIAMELARATPFFSMLQISPGSTSPALSNRIQFPYFYRTITPDQSHNEARKAFLRHFSWRYVATLNENTEAHALATNELVKALASRNVTFMATASIGESKIKSQLQIFKELDVRIILAQFSADFARKVFCEAFKVGLYGTRYVWMIPGNFPNRWWIQRDNHSACNDGQVEDAIEGHFTVTTSDILSGNRKGDAGITYEQFNELNGGRSFSPQAMAFDAVWTIAKIVRASLPTLRSKNLSPADFTYQNQEILDVYASMVPLLHFDGISGPIQFDGADRSGVSVFRQFQQREYKTIALYFPEDQELRFNCNTCTQISWGESAPVDHWIEITVIEGVEPQVLYGMTVLSSLGISVAIMLLYFNFHFRTERIVKLSSPKLNNTTACGCCLVYAFIITLGLDFTKTQDLDSTVPICQTRIFLISTGFSVAFGSLFLKTFRVHQIFRKASRGVIKSKLLKDNQLLCGVALLLGVDCLYLTIWFLADPIRMDLRSLPEVHPEPDIVLKRHVEVCDSNLMTTFWLPTMYIYKGAMLISGIFLTVETRHVKIPALNDSHAVGLSIYNVVICSIIAFALTHIISDHLTLRFILISSLAFATTTGTLCFLFVPKIIAVTKKTNEDPVLSGSGLTEQNNTRRLNIEDPRERFITAELLNRALKADITKLDSEIRRLERITQLPVVPRIKLKDEIFQSLPEYFVDTDSIVEKLRAAESRTQTLRAFLPLSRRDRSMDKSLDFSEHNIDIIIDKPEDTMVMETDKGNVTLLVKRDNKQANNTAAMAKFRKAMIRYKFIAVKPTTSKASGENEINEKEVRYSALNGDESQTEWNLP